MTLNDEFKIINMENLIAALEKRNGELEKQRELWKEEARRYAQNSDYWRKRCKKAKE